MHSHGLTNDRGAESPALELMSKWLRMLLGHLLNLQRGSY